MDDDSKPRNIAIIMDGNGRWARRRGLPRVAGHRAGALAVRRVTTECARLGFIDQLTLYAFSTENWQRPQKEVAFLMRMLERFMVSERGRIMKNNIRFRVIGNIRPLPEGTRAEIKESVRASAKNTGMTLCLAINYGSRAELVRAARALARDAASGAIAPADIDADAIEARLYTRGMREPDLLVRTAGEQRISNFLLWQCWYSEFHFVDVLWPDFGKRQLIEAVDEFARRKRNYGRIRENAS